MAVNNVQKIIVLIPCLHELVDLIQDKEIEQ
jgi:hypothetical protein